MMKHRRSRPESGRSRSARWRKQRSWPSRIRPRRSKPQAPGHQGRSIAPPSRASHDPAHQAARRNPHSPRPRAAASSPGGFRTPALSPVRTHAHGPASETLHRSRYWDAVDKQTRAKSSLDLNPAVSVPAMSEAIQSSRGNLASMARIVRASLGAVRDQVPSSVTDQLARLASTADGG